MAFNDYEDTLKSYIHDNDKLVTYKWLSKEFEVHVNVAKEILKHYYEKYKNEEKIVATFLIIGQLKDRSIRVEVVKESNLDLAKEKFLKIDCEHLYSLQKSLQNLELLAFADEDNLQYSAIKSKEDYTRNDEEIDNLRYVGCIKKNESKTVQSNVNANKIPKKDISQKVDSSKSSITFTNNGKEEKSSNNETVNEHESEKKKNDKKISPKTNSNSKTNNKVSKKPVQSKQSGFSNLFKKTADNTNKSQETVKGTDKVDDYEKNKNFSENLKKEDSQTSKKYEDRKKIDENKEKENDKERENKNKQSEEKLKKSNSKTDQVSKSKKNDRGKKRNRSQENNTSTKRKRILVMDSSEDESNDCNTDKEDDSMDQTEEQIPINRKRSPSPPAEKRENGKRMIRKYIDKTFKDEDGYLVTKRVSVYEAASDHEEPPEIKKEKVSKSKPVEVKAKKQTTLINFFKKS